jgi:hypothetical protein
MTDDHRRRFLDQGSRMIEAMQKLMDEIMQARAVRC